MTGLMAIGLGSLIVAPVIWVVCIIRDQRRQIEALREQAWGDLSQFIQRAENAQKSCNTPGKEAVARGNGGQQ